MYRVVREEITGIYQILEMVRAVFRFYRLSAGVRDLGAPHGYILAVPNEDPMGP